MDKKPKVETLTLKNGSIVEAVIINHTKRIPRYCATVHNKTFVTNIEIEYLEPNDNSIWFHNSIKEALEKCKERINESIEDAKEKIQMYQKLIKVNKKQLKSLKTGKYTIAKE